MSDTMTVLIHGTWSEYNLWYRPRSPFHRFIRDVFPNDHFELDPERIFTWNAGNTVSDRRQAACDLKEYCDNSGYEHFRLIGHSHGGTVANLATHMGIQVSTLILLATPVRFEDCVPPVPAPYYPDDHLPNVTSIADGKFFHFHADSDPVVQSVAHANQNYSGTSVADYEQEGISYLPVPFGILNHWEPTMSRAWRLNEWDQSFNTRSG